MGDLLVPYSLSDLFGKDRKNPPHFATGRDGMKTQSLLWKTTANIVDMNGKTKPLPVMLSRGGVHIIWAAAII